MENKFKSLESVIREMVADRNTKAREKVVNVGRANAEALAKQGEIKTKIIDEKKKVEKEDVMFGKGPPDNMSSPANSQTPVTPTIAAPSTPSMPNVWNNTPSMFMPKMPRITEAKDDEKDKKKPKSLDDKAIELSKKPLKYLSKDDEKEEPGKDTPEPKTPEGPSDKVANNDRSKPGKDKNYSEVENQDKTDSAFNPKKTTAKAQDHDLDDPGEIKLGGKTEVEMNPKTDDRVGSETEEDQRDKDSRKKANKDIGQKGAPEKDPVDDAKYVDKDKVPKKKENKKIGQKGQVKESIEQAFKFTPYHAMDHKTFGKILGRHGKTHLVDYDTADKITAGIKGSQMIKTLDPKRYIVKMPEHMKHGQPVHI